MINAWPNENTTTAESAAEPRKQHAAVTREGLDQSHKSPNGNRSALSCLLHKEEKENDYTNTR